MKQASYTHKEIEQLLAVMSKIYDLVRIVDPLECQELDVDERRVKPAKECYNVWSNKHRCAECSSYKACLSKRRMEKNEYHEGRTFHILSFPLEVINSDGSSYECVLECITIKDGIEQGKNQGVITKDESALVDSLTGLNNWDGFYKTVRKTLSQEDKHSWAILLFNFVNFKMINEIFGRDKGNEVLIKAASIIRSKLDPDECCARLRGDRFAVLVHQEKLNDDFLIDELSAIDVIDESEFKIKVQAGVYLIQDRFEPVSLMCDRAGVAISETKERSGLVYFEDSMMKKIMNEKYIADEFEKALEKNELKMYLQPQVSKDGKVIGVECLTRWQKEDGQMIMPDQFIYVLERSELIARLDMYIWEKAAEKLSSWKNSEFKDLYISVNISPRDFFYFNVYGYLNDLIRKYDIDKDKLKLEITESMMMNDEKKQLALVSRLHEAGFEIEIDDFGKGYSSLSLLKDIPADTLKIDKQFLEESYNNEKSERILDSVVDMARKLAMKVIVEGVENGEQLERLVLLGCDCFQGYYFSKPIAIADFEKLYLSKEGVII
ncbi:MAG: bifunctional diguanylate cyclase/phosphodiesterase [Erysipelotrichaceae bacterium]|nr:bifunctional diguanylate cyclase/phosphodiesterase [Erysipelotrichaceae bacterium]